MSLAGVAKQTVQVVERGEYVAPSGRTVSLREEVAHAVGGTVLYRPQDFGSLEVPASQGGGPRFEVTSEKTGQVGWRGRVVDHELTEKFREFSNTFGNVALATL